MKKIRLFLGSILLTAAAFTLQSCLNGEGGNDYSLLYPNALVTVKPDAGNTSFRMQLDEETVLWPVNLRTSPFGEKEVRALVNFREPTAAERENGGGPADMVDVYVNWIDSVLTKPLAENLGDERNALTYGNDPVEIVNDWVTIAEDGYLTLRIRTRWGTVKHRLSLVYKADSDTPYHVRFYHDANGDFGDRVGDALVAFRLDELPDTEGKTVDLTLEWQSFSGPKTAQFKYCTRKASGTLPANVVRATETEVE